MSNRVSASKGDRAVVVRQYNTLEPSDFRAWVRSIAHTETIVSVFRFGNNHKMKETAKHLGCYQHVVVNYNQPSGYTCGNAAVCKTYALRNGGGLRREGEVLCFAAKMEVISKWERDNSWINLLGMRALQDLDYSPDAVAMLLLQAQQQQFPGSKFMRIHAAGDFNDNDYYFDVVSAWAQVLDDFNGGTIFGYTKYLKYVLANRPESFRLVYSWGGLDDDWAVQEKQAGTQFGTNRIRLYDGDPECEGLPVSCGPDDPGDDIKYILAEQDFCIDLH